LKEYYERRAAEYDDWYLGLGGFDDLPRPKWDDDLHDLEVTLRALSPARTLDVACGTGFLTRHLSGQVVAVDQSDAMVEIARRRAPEATLLRGDALALPFENGSFERVFTAHFYGHLQEAERVAFLAEARRVAPQLVVVDAALRPDRREEEWEERQLSDGSRWTVYKRYFTGAGLAEELGGGDVVLENRWFVVVRSSLATRSG